MTSKTSSEHQSKTSSQTRYIPVSQFDQYHPWPTPQAIRNRINKAKRGTDPDFLKCVVRKGGRVLIDESTFFEWAKSENSDEAA